MHGLCDDGGAKEGYATAHWESPFGAVRSRGRVFGVVSRPRGVGAPGWSTQLSEDAVHVQWQAGSRSLSLLTFTSHSSSPPPTMGGPTRCIAHVRGTGIVHDTGHVG